MGERGLHELLHEMGSSIRVNVLTLSYVIEPLLTRTARPD